MRSIATYVITLTIAFVLVLITTLGAITWYESLSVALFIASLLKFINDLGKNLSIKNIIAVICTLQWLVGPVLGYYYDDLIFQSYKMAVDKATYFSYVLPATLLFLAGLYVTREKYVNFRLLRTLPIDFYRKGRFYIILGVVMRYLPLGFVGFLLSNLMFVGAFYMFASNHKAKYYWLLFVFGNLVIRSVGTGFFHEMLLWGSFLMMMYFLTYPKPYWIKLSLILAGFGIVYLIQIAKSDYRKMLWSGQLAGGSKIGAFLSTIDKNVDAPEDKAENDFGDFVVRINQGWIISHVLENMPAHEPFANGATVKNAIIATIFPRFLMPHKEKAGGSENMLKYAGVYILTGVSMDISTVAEAYANFGALGGMIFMFLLGVFFNWILKKLTHWGNRYPDLLFWIPLIFLQTVKAETSLATVLNHLVKAGILTWFFFSPWGNYLINYQFVKKKKQENNVQIK